MLQNDDGVGIADRCLHQTLGILRRVGRHDLEAGAVGVPRREALRVLCGGTGGVAVGATENDRAGNVTGRHVVLLGGRVDNLIDGLHGEVHRHELDDGPELLEGGTDGKAGEAHLCDRRIDDALVAILLVQALGHLVGTLVLRHLLAEDEYSLVGLHLLVDALVDGLTDRHVDGGHASGGILEREASL